MIGAVVPSLTKIAIRLQLQFFSRCCVGIDSCNATPFFTRVIFEILICTFSPPMVLARGALAQRSAIHGALLHCDFRLRWIIANDLRFGAVTSEPQTMFSVGNLAICPRECGNR